MIPDSLKKNPAIKPLLVAVSVLLIVNIVEWVMLIVAEIQDGNPMSAVVRLVSLIVLGVVGFWARRAFKQAHSAIEAQMQPVPVAVDDTDFLLCKGCEQPLLWRGDGGPQPQLCPECWRLLVDERLVELERTIEREMDEAVTKLAKASNLMERAPTTIRDRSPRAPFTMSELPDVDEAPTTTAPARGGKDR